MKFLCCVEVINGKFRGSRAVPISDVKSITHWYEVHFADENEPVGDVWDIRLHSDSRDSEFIIRQMRSVEVVKPERLLEKVKEKMLLAEEWNQEFNRCQPIQREVKP